MEATDLYGKLQNLGVDVDQIASLIALIRHRNHQRKIILDERAVKKSRIDDGLKKIEKRHPQLESLEPFGRNKSKVLNSYITHLVRQTSLSDSRSIYLSYRLTNNSNIDLSHDMPITISNVRCDDPITDNDGQPSFTIADVTVSEKDSRITFTVIKTGLTDRSWSFDYSVDMNAAVASGDDSFQMSELTGLLTFNAGVVTQTVTLNIISNKAVRFPTKKIPTLGLDICCLEAVLSPHTQTPYRYITAIFNSFNLRPETACSACLQFDKKNRKCKHLAHIFHTDCHNTTRHALWQIANKTKKIYPGLIERLRKSTSAE